MGLLFNLRHGRAVTPKRAQGTRTLPEAQADRARGVLDNEIDADRAQLMDVERLQNWETMGPHAERAAADSQAASSGQVHGAPRGVTDPAVTDGLAREYAEHIKAALDAGVNPDYFYADGRSAIAGISQPGQEVRNAGLYGFTSAQVGPHLNMNFTARALDQYNMAGPEAVNSTLYPNKARAPLNDIIHGLAPWQGWKRERYKNLLTPTNDAEMAMRRGDIDHRPPNDRHEGRAAGFEGQPTSAPQVAYTDTVRNRAIEFVNADLEAAGMPPLNQEQAQALHWIHRRAQAEGLPTEVTRADTVLGSAELQTVQHGWESMPGQTANHLPEVGSPGGMSPLELHDRYTGIALDPATGKDRFISGMGGELQLPAIHGGGYYNGQINPGTQSRSIGGSTQRGIDPHTAARVDGTEATRALMMGQDAAAYSNTRPLASTERLRDANAFEVKLPEGALSHEQLAAFAPDFEAHGAFLVPTPEGFRVMTGGSKFADPEGVARALDNIAPGQYQPAVTDGNYFELDWQGGNATRGMLERIDNPIAPALQQWADSPAMRQLAGDFADEFEALAARGLTPNDQLADTLRVWRDEGLPGVRELVKKGLAPAAALAALTGLTGIDAATNPAEAGTGSRAVARAASKNVKVETPATVRNRMQGHMTRYADDPADTLDKLVGMVEEIERYGANKYNQRFKPAEVEALRQELFDNIQQVQGTPERPGRAYMRGEQGADTAGLLDDVNVTPNDPNLPTGVDERMFRDPTANPSTQFDPYAFMDDPNAAGLPAAQYGEMMSEAGQLAGLDHIMRQVPPEYHNPGLASGTFFDDPFTDYRPITGDPGRRFSPDEIKAENARRATGEHPDKQMMGVAGAVGMTNMLSSDAADPGVLAEPTIQDDNGRVHANPSAGELIRRRNELPGLLSSVQRGVQIAGETGRFLSDTAQHVGGRLAERGRDTLNTPMTAEGFLDLVKRDIDLASDVGAFAGDVVRHTGGMMLGGYAGLANIPSHRGDAGEVVEAVRDMVGYDTLSEDNSVMQELGAILEHPAAMQAIEYLMEQHDLQSDEAFEKGPFWYVLRQMVNRLPIEQPFL